jgi:hypothetical protein
MRPKILIALAIFVALITPSFAADKLAPIELKDMRPAFFTVRVKCNGSSGRVMFEIVDATGRVWTSSGYQLPGATNASDSEGVSFISFDGWQTIQMSLPGQYESPDQFVHWLRNFDW